EGCYNRGTQPKRLQPVLAERQPRVRRFGDEGGYMLTGEIRSQIDSIWNDFWSGGVSNPLSVIEQITYLLFIKRLDELQTVEERKATTLNIPLERRIFPTGRDDRGRPYADLRWSRFKQFEPREMFKVID